MTASPWLPVQKWIMSLICLTKKLKKHCLKSQCLLKSIQRTEIHGLLIFGKVQTGTGSNLHAVESTVLNSPNILKKAGKKEKLVVKAPVVVEKPVAQEPVQLKIPVNKNICVVPISDIDPKPKIEKIVANPDKVWIIPYYLYQIAFQAWSHWNFWSKIGW